MIFQLYSNSHSLL